MLCFKRISARSSSQIRDNRASCANLKEKTCIKPAEIQKMREAAKPKHDKNHPQHLDYAMITRQSLICHCPIKSLLQTPKSPRAPDRDGRERRFGTLRSKHAQRFAKTTALYTPSGWRSGLLYAYVNTARHCVSSLKELGRKSPRHL